MKTITELNDKAWYRLLKVIYVLIFLIILLFCNMLIFGEGLKRIDQNKTQIMCNFKDKRVFSLKSIGLTLDRNDFLNYIFDYKYFFEGYNDYNVQKIWNACYDKAIDINDIFPTQRYYELKLNEVGAEEFIPAEKMDEIIEIRDAITKAEKAKYLDYSVHLFEIKPVFTYKNFITFFIFGNLGILLLYEIIKRIFYYIVLGTFRPQRYIPEKK